MQVEQSIQRGVWSQIAVYVLSVKTFDDRIKSVRSQLDSLQIPFQFVFRFDLVDFDRDPVTLSIKKDAPLSQKEVSLIAKHVESWRLGMVSGKPYVLVLEDDFILAPNFLEQFHQLMQEIKNLGPGFLINLGGANARLPFSFFLNKAYFFRFRFETAEGYLSDRLALVRRLSWLDRHPVDLPADHLIRGIDQEQDTPHFWPPDALLGQGSLYGLFASALDERRSQRSRFLLRMSYLSKKFRRRIFPKFLANLLRWAY